MSGETKHHDSASRRQERRRIVRKSIGICIDGLGRVRSALFGAEGDRVGPEAAPVEERTGKPRRH